MAFMVFKTVYNRINRFRVWIWQPQLLYHSKWEEWPLEMCVCVFWTGLIFTQDNYSTHDILWHGIWYAVSGCQRFLVGGAKRLQGLWWHFTVTPNCATGRGFHFAVSPVVVDWREWCIFIPIHWRIHKEGYTSAGTSAMVGGLLRNHCVIHDMNCTRKKPWVNE